MEARLYIYVSLLSLCMLYAAKSQVLLAGPPSLYDEETWKEEPLSIGPPSVNQPEETRSQDPTTIGGSSSTVDGISSMRQNTKHRDYCLKHCADILKDVLPEITEDKQPSSTRGGEPRGPTLASPPNRFPSPASPPGPVMRGSASYPGLPSPNSWGLPSSGSSSAGGMPGIISAPENVCPDGYRWAQLSASEGECRKVAAWPMMSNYE